MQDTHFQRWNRRLTFCVALFLGSCSLSYAQDDVRKCHLAKFLRSIGYEGVLRSDDALVSLEESLGDEARCAYRVQFASCIGTALGRFDAAMKLRPSSARAKHAILMVNVTKAIVEHGVEFTYNVRKPGLFSGPKFSNVEASEYLFGFPMKGSSDIFDQKTLAGWRYLCSLGSMSERRFMKEIGADKDFGGPGAD